MEVEMLRMAERIVIAMGGILSVILGYKLFSIANNKTDSGADFKSSMLSVSFTKVGPGVFFALFGAYIMSTSIKTQIDIETNQGNREALNQSAILSKISNTITKLPDSAEKGQLSDLIRQLNVNTKFISKRTLID